MSADLNLLRAKENLKRGLELDEKMHDGTMTDAECLEYNNLCDSHLTDLIIVRSEENTRLREQNKIMREALEGAIVTLEAWADLMDRDPCNNDNYCRAKDSLAKVKGMG